MIEPRERLLWAVVAVGVVGVAGLAVPVVGGFAPFLLVGLFVAVVVDTVLARSPKQVLVLRRLPERLIEDRPASVVLELKSRRRVDVEVTDTVRGEPWSSARVLLDTADDVITAITLPPRRRRRGDHGLGHFTVRTFGPLGLVARRHRRAGVGDPVVVALDSAAIADTATRLVRGADVEGARRRRAVERGRELDSLRDYRRGDDVRLVDWKATARRGSLVVKELVPETRQDVVVVLDAGRQLGGRRSDNDRPRFDTAVVTGLLVAAAALDRGDRAGLVVVDDDVRAFVPPHEGRATLKRLADATADVVAVAVEPAYQELAAFLIARLKRRSLICLVTDVVDEAGARSLARALGSLRGRHLVLVIAMADSDLHRFARSSTRDRFATADAANHADHASAAAATLLLSHRRRALKALESSAVVVDTIDEDAGAAAIAAWWRVKASGRL